VSVLSTIPVNFEGGIQADLSSAEYDRRRETFDVDDFGSGFAVWSGTSFAAPVVAGRIAQKLQGPQAASAAAVAGGPTPRVAAAVAAAGTIVENAKTEDDSSVDAPQAAAPPE
jgi:subtilisin family serine protease